MRYREPIRSDYDSDEEYERAMEAYEYAEFFAEDEYMESKYE